MDKQEGFEIIMNAFKHHLDKIKKHYPENILKLELKDVEISEKSYADHITFNIIAKYNHTLPNSKVINYTVDEVYKFSDYEKYFPLEKEVHFYYIFTS